MSEKYPAGAPKGNRNARKHGFYSTNFPSPGREKPADVAKLNLSDEIGLLRLYIRRVVELTPPDEGLESARETLRLLCLASTALSRLVRAQYLVQGSQAESVADVISAIAEESRQIMAARASEIAAKSPPPKTAPGAGHPDPNPLPSRACTPQSVVLSKDSGDAPGAPGGVTLGLGSSSRFVTSAGVPHPVPFQTAASPDQKRTAETLGPPAGESGQRKDAAPVRSPALFTAPEPIRASSAYPHPGRSDWTPPDPGKKLEWW